MSSFVSYGFGDPAKLHSFPTRRSSDLDGEVVSGTERQAEVDVAVRVAGGVEIESTRLNSSHITISYAVFCLKKKKLERLPTTLKTERSSFQPRRAARRPCGSRIACGSR